MSHFLLYWQEVERFQRTNKMDVRRLHELYSERVLQPKKKGDQTTTRAAYQSAPFGENQQHTGVNMEWDRQTRNLEDELEQIEICIKPSQRAITSGKGVTGTLNNKTTGKDKDRQSAESSQSQTNEITYDISGAVKLITMKDELTANLCNFILDRKKAIDRMA